MKKRLSSLVISAVTVMALLMSVFAPFVAGLEAPNVHAPTVSGTTVTISWDPVSGADGYEYTWSANDSSSGGPQRTSGTSINFTIGYNEPFSGNVFAYKNATEESGAESSTATSFSGTTGAAPAQPPEQPTLNGTPEITSNSIKIKWTAVAGCTYTVQISPGQGEVPAGSNSEHTFTGLTPETSYSYSVWAHKDGLTSSAATG